MTSATPDGVGGEDAADDTRGTRSGVGRWVIVLAASVPAASTAPVAVDSSGNRAPTRTW